MLEPEIIINDSAIESLRKGFSARSQRAMLTSFKVEGFRLKGIVEKELSGGIGPRKAALTKLEAKNQGGEALSAFGMGHRIIGYAVTPQPANIELKVGFSQWISRAPSRARGRKTNITTVVSGGTHRITRQQQKAIARRLRRRMGEPVARARKDGSVRKARRPGRYDWADLSIMIPPEGAVVDWPERDFVGQVLRKERRNIINNIRTNYARKLLGERI